MFDFVLLLLVVLVLFHPCSTLNKCCDSDSFLDKTKDNVYFCDKDEDKRVQVFTKYTNFFQTNTTDEVDCIDVRNQHIYKYNVMDQNVTEEEPINVNYFPKCCPLNHYYNSVTHSCSWKDNIEDKFITQNFVKVGLPNCKMIVDVKLKSVRDYMIESDSLYLTNFNFGSIPFGSYCVDKDEENNFIVRGCPKEIKRMCDKMMCVHKCCPDGQSFVNGKKCVNTYVHGVDLGFSNRINDSQVPFAIIHQYDCRIYIMKESKYDFYLDNRGIFWAYYNKTNSYQRYNVDQKSYCIEHVKKDSLNNFQFFMCFPSEPLRVKFEVSRWAKIVSCIFVIVTMAVYIVLPELMNLFGRILMSYCSAMLACFTFLTYLQFEEEPSDAACVVLSFLASFASLCSFTWLNVMCFDIWWTFGSPKSFYTIDGKRKEHRKFLFYSLYGWGVPLLLTLITLACYVETTPYAIRPFIGAYQCFWENRPGNYGKLLYYLTPMIFIEISNLVLFVQTIIYCLKVKGEIQRMNDNRMSVKERRRNINADKEQLALVLKLSVTMGISFTFEVVSAFYDYNLHPVTKYIEVVWDTFNCLQGLFIFLIFICKRKVFALLHNKLCGAKSRKISTSSVITGHGSNTTLTSPGSKYKVSNVYV